MAKIKYKEPSIGMTRMMIKSNDESRPSLGMTEIKGEVYYLSPDLIIPYKNQARRIINEKDLSELTSSIQSQGIIQPLQIIKSFEHEGKFEVISGERRLRAAKKLDLAKVPCMILDRDRDADEIALIENIQRENLHPVELADAIAHLLKNKKYMSQTEAAERIGVSKQQISHLLAVSRLPEDVKQYLYKKKDININFLKKIAYLRDETEIREKIFREKNYQNKYKSVLRLSSNGKDFRFDHLKLDKLSVAEKLLLKNELLNLIKRLEI